MAELWYPPLDCDACVLLGPTVPVGRYTQLDYHPSCGGCDVYLHWLLGCGRGN